MVEVLFFLVIQGSNSMIVVPAPYTSEAACNSEAAKHAKTFWRAVCVRVEAKKEQK